MREAISGSVGATPGLRVRRDRAFGDIEKKNDIRSVREKTLDLLFEKFSRFMDGMRVDGGGRRDARRFELRALHGVHAPVGKIGDIRHKGSSSFIRHAEAEAPFRSDLPARSRPRMEMNEKRGSDERVTA
jgi:hypothetical protein